MQLTLKFVREHGFVHAVPIADKADRPLASFVGIRKDHPWAQRPFDDKGAMLPVDQEPNPEDKLYYRNAWQRIAVYATSDGHFELSTWIGPEEEPRPEVTIDVHGPA